MLRNKPGGRGVTAHDGGLFKAMRDEDTVVADDEEQLRPRAKFNSGITTYRPDQ